MSKPTIHFTLFISFLLLAACGAKNSGNNASSVSAPAVASTPLVLVATASSSSVSTGSTVTLSVIGGSEPYNWVITSSGGGTLNSSIGASVIYTASNMVGLASLSVTDAVGNKAVVSVNVISGTTTPAATLCSGNYSATLGSYTASFQFSTSGSGALSGYMQYAGHQYPLTGTCTASAIRFTLTETGDAFQGSFTAASPSATRSPMRGTYFNVYYQSTQNWTATPK